MAERHTLVVDGVRISYLERVSSTTSTRAPLLILHGLIATASTFDALIAEMPSDRRVIALDLPGTAVSSANDEQDLGFEGLARLVRNFAEQAGMERPVVLGHSHGGALALRIAASYRNFPSALILLSPAHPYLLRERPLIAFYLSWPGRMFARLLPWLPRSVQLLGFRRMLGPKGRKRPIDFTPYRKRLQVPNATAEALQMLRSWNADMETLAQDIEKAALSVPTLFLWGDHDMVVPISTAPALQKHLLLWEQFTLKNVGHLPNEEAVEDSGGLIRTWLIWLDTHLKYSPVASPSVTREC